MKGGKEAETELRLELHYNMGDKAGGKVTGSVDDVCAAIIEMQ